MKIKLEQLRREFEDEVYSSIEECKKIKYNPKSFLRMVDNHNRCFDACRTAIKEYTTGFSTLLLKGRLDLTIEYLVVKDKYQHLFTKREIEDCKKRLGIKDQK